MFRFPIFFFAAVFLILVGCQENNSSGPISSNPIPLTAPVTVSINDNYFGPANITVPVGATITWQDYGYNNHTVTNGTPGDTNAGNLFDSGTLSYGRSYHTTFSRAGTVKYFCRFHGTMGMVGTVTVGP